MLSLKCRSRIEVRLFCVASLNDCGICDFFNWTKKSVSLSGVRDLFQRLEKWMSSKMIVRCSEELIVLFHVKCGLSGEYLSSCTDCRLCLSRLLVSQELCPLWWTFPPWWTFPFGLSNWIWEESCLGKTITTLTLGHLHRFCSVLRKTDLRDLSLVSKVPLSYLLICHHSLLKSEYALLICYSSLSNHDIMIFIFFFI